LKQLLLMNFHKLRRNIWVNNEKLKLINFQKMKNDHKSIKPNLNYLKIDM